MVSNDTFIQSDYAVRSKVTLYVIGALVFVTNITSLHAEGVIKASEADFYRIVTITTSQASDSRAKNWKPAPDSLVLEVSGLAKLPDGRMAVATRKGEVWFLSNVYDDPPSNIGYHRIASGLHEPLGLLFHQGSLVTVQRTEMTRLLDNDRDDICDEYQTMASGWGVTGNYHEYAFGPEADSAGNLWLTLNLGLGLKGDQKSAALTNSTLGFSQALW